MTIKVYADHFPEFAGESKEVAEFEYQEFLENLELLLKHGSTILSYPNYYFVEIQKCYNSILWFGGGGLLYLGFLLEGWRSGVLVDCCEHCCGEFYVMGFGGSILSGSNKFWGVCRSCREPACGRVASGDRFRSRVNWVIQMRAKHPRRRQEWQVYNGFIFTFEGNGMKPSIKKRLVSIDLAEPVPIHYLIKKLSI